MKIKAMRVLGIETSGSICSVAYLSFPPLYMRPKNVWALLAKARLKERRESGDGPRHSEAIYGLLNKVLPGGRRGVKTLNLIAVSMGPGSFTGLRVGLAVAKTFAKFGGISLIGVPTLEAVAAEAMRGESAPCYVPTLDARRGELYVQVFRAVGSALKSVRGPWVCAPEDLHESLPKGARLIDIEQPCAAVVAALGVVHHLAGKRDNPDRLEPIYVRRPEAIEKLRRGMLGKKDPAR